MMTPEFFEKAVDSMKGYEGVVGMLGGEPLLHPKFEELCKIMQKKLPKGNCGLWTCLPKGYEHYREIIVETFGHIFLNDHTRHDVMHCPVLVASKEINNEGLMWYSSHHCWLQNSWSASINPNGAFFCEVAAAMSILFDIKNGWEVEPKWWLKVPIHYIDQMKEYCPRCGVCLPFPKRSSTDETDDISQGNYDALKDISPRLKAGKYQISDLQLAQDDRPMASYKDPRYRDEIAKRYGMFLEINERRYQTPYLYKNFKKEN
jgi:hypothetical protein